MKEKNLKNEIDLLVNSPNISEALSDKLKQHKEELKMKVEHSNYEDLKKNVQGW